MKELLARLLILCAVLAAVWLFVGCASVPSILDAPIVTEAGPAVATNAPGSGHAAAVCVGLTTVDPASYGGWDGYCPGTDVDARGVFELARSRGLSATLLLNAETTWAKVRAAVLAAAAPLSRGDLLVLMMSGHGGQIADDNGDEGDGQDETVCLWDGQVRDDRVLELLHELPPGLRVVLINDQCHSEGNFRAFGRAIQRTVSFGAWGRITARALIQPRAEWDGELIQFAGCREASYSYGAAEGGTWTQSLLGRWVDGITWAEWFTAAAAAMPGNQVPVWVEHGQTTDAFRNAAAMKSFAAEYADDAEGGGR